MAEWNTCPFELKESIVMRARENTRRALGACSLSSKQLVDETRINGIDQILVGRDLFEHPDKWAIMVNKTTERVPLQSSDAHEFDTFEELQNELSLILKRIHYVKNLVIQNLEPGVVLKLEPSKLGSKLLVENVIIVEQAENIISQLEPIYLRKITFITDLGDAKIYDMPQVINAESLRVYRSSSIREDQLMKLQARYILIRGIQCSITQYVKKCALDAGTKLPQFLFGGLNVFSEFENMRPHLSRKVVLKTDHPQLNLELEVSVVKHSEWKYELEGRILFDSELTASNFWRGSVSGLRKLESLTFVRDRKLKNWNIKVKRSNYDEAYKCNGPEKYDYNFFLFENAQEKLNEILDNTDLIGYVSISFEGSEKRMKWSKKDKKLMIGELYVTGDHSITSICDLMPQIEIEYLKRLKITSKEVDNQILDIPHIMHVKFLGLSGVVLTDSQLLSINAQMLSSTDKHSNGVQNKSLTANGINQHMKKCLIDTEQPCHIFVFKNLSETLNVEEMFEGCNIVMSESVENCFLKIINVPETEGKYELVVEFDNNSLYGVRRKVNQPIESLWLLKQDIAFFIALSTPRDFTSI